MKQINAANAKYWQSLRTGIEVLRADEALDRERACWFERWRQLCDLEEDIEWEYEYKR